MSLIEPFELLLLNIEEDVDPSYVNLYMRKEVALHDLKDLTGQDFGYDGKTWRKWLMENGFLPKSDGPAKGTKAD